MKKKIFYGFSFFVFLFMIAAWQLAAAELADLQSGKDKIDNQDPNKELAFLP